MSASANKVLEEALSLPAKDRLFVAQSLLDSIPGDTDGELEGAWRVEVLRRIAEVRRGEVEPESWSEVREHIREALER